MAFSAVTARGSATEKVSDTTLAMSPSANITVGKLAFFQCATDNIATTDGASSNHSVADSVGNVWNKIAEYTDSDGAGNDGVTISIWATRVTVQIGTGDTITLTTSSNVTNKIISLFEVTVGTGMSFGIEQVGLGQSAISASVSSLPNREYLLIGFGGSEGNDNSKTADADYTERFDLRTGSGTAATEICTHVQTRIATLTSDTCTSTAWTNTNPVTVLVAVFEVPIGGLWNPPPKPQVPIIEWDDPLTRNLVLDVPFTERGGVKPYDVVSGIRGSMQGTPSWKDTKHGRVVDFSSGADSQVGFLSHPKLGKFTAITVEFAIYMLDGGGTNYGYIFAHEEDSQNKHWFGMGLDNWTSGWGLRIDAPDDSTDRAFSVPYPEIRKWEHYVVTYDHSSTSNIPIVYKNGVPISVTDRFNGAWVLSTTPTDFVIGNEEGAIGIAANQNFGGYISHLRYWNRILTAGEARSLFENPWRIYEQPNRYQPLNLITAGSNFTQNLSDTTTLSDSIVNGVGKILSDTVTMTDAAVKSVMKAASDAVTITDNIVNGIGKVFADTISITDDAFRSVGKAISDSVSLSDLLSRTWTALYSLSDSTTITDSISKLPGKILSDTVSLADSIVNGIGTALSDALTLSDDIIKGIGKGLSDAITLSDEILFGGALSKVLADSITITDSISKSVVKSVTDAITLSDSIIKSFGQYLSDTLSIGDAINAIRGIYQSIADTITLADNIALVWIGNKFLALADSIHVTDSLGGAFYNIASGIPRIIATFGNFLIGMARAERTTGMIERVKGVMTRAQRTTGMTRRTDKPNIV